MRTLLHTLTAAAALGAALPVAAQTATHVYHLDGSLTDARGGPSLVGLGGTTGPSGYTFAANKGLTLVNAIDPHVYSLELAFSFDDVSGFRKVLDFQGRSSDHGLYVNHGALTFFGVSIPRGAEVFQPGQTAHLVVTRDASKRFTAYVNGIARFGFTDTFDRAVFSAPGSLVSLFVDDLARGTPAEASGGSIDYLRVYDVALSGEQAAIRYQNGDTDPPPPVTTAPEPATVTLLATGVLALAVGARRRRATVG